MEYIFHHMAGLGQELVSQAVLCLRTVVSKPFRSPLLLSVLLQSWAMIIAQQAGFVSRPFLTKLRVTERWERAEM